MHTPIYRHAANYVGRQVRPLPPVTSPDRVVAAVVRALDRPEREIIVGGRTTLGVRTPARPRLYDRLAGPVVNEGALRDIPVLVLEAPYSLPTLRAKAVDEGWPSTTTAS